MRVLALYDIHGNPAAPRAVLAEPDARAAEAVVVGGDAVPGPFAAETLTLLRDLDRPTHWVRHATPRRDDEMVTREVIARRGAG